MTWITEFFNALPGWGWIALYGGTGALVASGVLALRKERISKAIHEGFWKDEFVPVNIFGAIAALVCSIITLVNTFGGLGFLEAGRFACLRMMAVGVAAYGLPLGSYHAVRGIGRLKAWCARTFKAYQHKKSRDPKHVLAHCRQLFAHASRNRIKSSSTSLDETAAVMGFSQAGDSMLTMLKDLFELVHDLDDWFAAADVAEADRNRADAIFPEVALERYRSLVGANARMSVETLGVLRDCARGSIEDIVLFFMRLPNNVREANIYQKAAGIEGWQRLLSEVSPLPETSPSIETIADFETGKLQERLLARLAQSSVRSVATAPHPVDESSVPARAKVRA